MYGHTAPPLQTVDVAEICACLLDTLGERLLTLTNPHTGVIVLRWH